MRTYYVRLMVNALNKKENLWSFPSGTVVGTQHSLLRAGDQSLVGKLGTHKPLNTVGQKIFFLSSSSLTCSWTDGRRQAGKWLVMI